jgi:hypothetical protein
LISALVGIAIGRGILHGTDQRIAPILRSDIPSGADPDRTTAPGSQVPIGCDTRFRNPSPMSLVGPCFIRRARPTCFRRC